MTQSRRTALFLSLLLVVSSGAAAWAVADTGSSVQAQDGTNASDSFQVENISATSMATTGERITVTATVSYSPDGEVVTETEAGTETETEAGTETEDDVEPGQADENETETEVGATETETATGETVTQAVEFRLDGDVVERQMVELAPGESTEVTFELNTSELDPGVYIHGVYTEDFGAETSLLLLQGDGAPTETETETETEIGTETETETETELGTETETATGATAQGDEFEGPSFDVRNLSAPSTVTAGDTVTVTARITLPENASTETETELGTGTETEAGVTETETETEQGDETETEFGTETETATGGEDGITREVEYRVDGDVVDRQNVTLAPGESTEVTFELDTSELDLGVHIHGVMTRDYGDLTPLTVLSEQTETETETETGTETEAGTETETEAGDDTGAEEETEAEGTPTETDAT